MQEEARLVQYCKEMMDTKAGLYRAHIRTFVIVSFLFFKHNYKFRVPNHLLEELKVLSCIKTMLILINEIIKH